jgi:hypothetical protein
MKFILTTLAALFALSWAAVATDDARYPVNVTVGSTWIDGVFKWSRNGPPTEEAPLSSTIEMKEQFFHVIPDIGFGPGEADHSVNLDFVHKATGANLTVSLQDHVSWQSLIPIQCTIDVVDFAAQNDHFVMFKKGEQDNTINILKAPGIEVVCQ